jgi:CysZ protein
VRVVQDFFRGVGLLLRGLRLYGTNPRLVLLGVLPALITGAVFIGLYVVLAVYADNLAAAVTPFADGWSRFARETVRGLAQIAFLGSGALIAVLLFTATTLLVGDPFYERISELVEEREDGRKFAWPEVPWWRSLRRSIPDSLRLVAVSVLVGIPLFAAGFIPVVGQTVVPVIGATIGGWLLALELTGAAFYRRGLRLRQRRAALGRRRALALGFGVGVFVCFLIPLGAVLIMPAAVAGATLLAREALRSSPGPPAPSAAAPPARRPPPPPA